MGSQGGENGNNIAGAKQKCVGTNHCPGGGKLTCLLQQSTLYGCSVHTAIGSTNKKYMMITKKKSLLQMTFERINETYSSATGFSSLQAVSARKSRASTKSLSRKGVLTLSSIW